jgi:hypothetical protein
VEEPCRAEPQRLGFSPTQLGSGEASGERCDYSPHPNDHRGRESQDGCCSERGDGKALRGYALSVADEVVLLGVRNTVAEPTLFDCSVTQRNKQYVSRRRLCCLGCRQNNNSGRAAGGRAARVKQRMRRRRWWAQGSRGRREIYFPNENEFRSREEAGGLVVCMYTQSGCGGRGPAW